MASTISDNQPEFSLAAPIINNVSFPLCRGIYAGTATGVAGTITAIVSNGDTVVFTGILAGSINPIRCTQINASGTTATNLVALY